MGHILTLECDSNQIGGRGHNNCEMGVLGSTVGVTERVADINTTRHTITYRRGRGISHKRWSMLVEFTAPCAVCNVQEGRQGWEQCTHLECS